MGPLPVAAMAQRCQGTHESYRNDVVVQYPRDSKFNFWIYMGAIIPQERLGSLLLGKTSLPAGY